jgi:hypothetical protein
LCSFVFFDGRRNDISENARKNSQEKSQNPVFSRQIFGEMLAEICHKEFYSHFDQEVSSHSHFPQTHIFIIPPYGLLHHFSLIVLTICLLPISSCVFQTCHDTTYEEQEIPAEIALSSMTLYDFCYSEGMGEWLDVLIALSGFAE